MRNSELIKLLQKEEEIIIVGYGITGKYLYNLLSEEIVFKVYVCDNSKKKRQETMDVEVFSVEDAVCKYPNALFLYGNSKNGIALQTQLVSLGIDVARILCGETEESLLYLNEIKLKKSERVIQPLSKIQFEINLVEHCNLKCKCCSQLSCIAEPEYYDLEQYKKDMARMSELFCGKCEHIYLIGGEPLLHPNIITMMSMARAKFVEGDISVFTNGLLLSNQTEVFWKTCTEKEIAIILTKYPVKIDYEKIEALAEYYGVSLSYFNDPDLEKKMVVMNWDEFGNQDMEYSFYHCPEANQCIKLKNGKLYTCSVAPSFYKYNKHFGRTFIESDEDWIDIYGNYSATEIMQFLAHPIPACRYCDKVHDRKVLPWAQTSGEKYEWIVSNDDASL